MNVTLEVISPNYKSGENGWFNFTQPNVFMRADELLTVLQLAIRYHADSCQFNQITDVSLELQPCDHIVVKHWLTLILSLSKLYHSKMCLYIATCIADSILILTFVMYST